jgi:4-carboxymuconolactone decarboxylase
MTIGVLATLGQNDLLDVQFDSALTRGEFTVDQIREVVVHLTHYIGWPLSVGLNQTAEHVIARRAKASAADSTHNE